MADESFKTALAAAKKALDLVGTGKLRGSEVRREGPRTYALGRLANSDERGSAPPASTPKAAAG